MKIALKHAAISIALLGLAGCATLSPQPAFDDVAYNVQSRIGKQIAWDTGSQDDRQAKRHIAGMLSRRLTPSGAIQIALLNNKSLQASYANLGMAQADLVQAGLLTNPILDGEVLWPYSPESAAANITLGVIFNFIELFWKRYKEAVATSALEETKLQISGAVIEHAADTHRAFIDYVAAKQEVNLLREVVTSARATLTAARAIREAGNSTSLEFEQQQNVLTQTKLELAAAEVRAAEAREATNVLMGLTGGQTKRWRAPSRLQQAKGRLPRLAGVELRAVEHSLNLAELRQKIITLGYKHQLTNKQVLIPDIGVGVQWEKKETEKEIGPRFDVTLPLFDRGEAKRARAIMEIRQAQDQYWAMGIRVRSAARLAKAALLTTRKTDRYYRNAILPQQVRLLKATQQQYNAMQSDVFRLIRAKRDQIQARRNAIAALRACWRAYVDFQQLMSGRLPGGAGNGSMVVAAAAAGAGEGAGH